MSLHVGVGCLNLNVEQQCKMPKAYSEDLRWRAVWLSIVRGMSYSDIATVLFMSEKSVYRYISLFHATGTVEPKQPTGDCSKGLTDFESFTVLQSSYTSSAQGLP